jgi:hypothetical protein
VSLSSVSSRIHGSNITFSVTDCGLKYALKSVPVLSTDRESPLIGKLFGLQLRRQQSYGSQPEIHRKATEASAECEFCHARPRIDASL